MQDFLLSFSELGEGFKVFLILLIIFFITLGTYLVIQSFRKGEF